MKIVKMVVTDDSGIEHTFEGSGHVSLPMRNHQEKRAPYKVFTEHTAYIRINEQEEKKA